MMASVPPASRRHPIRSAAQRHLGEADPLGLQAVRGELEHRLKSQRERLDEHQRMARALRVGSAPPVLAEVRRALCEHDLMGKNVLIIGTNAIYAYEALAGVRLQGDVTATQDIDVLFKHQSRLTVAARGIGPEGLLGVLKKVDKTFEISSTQAFRARTPKPPWKQEPHNLGDADPFVATDIPNMDWMLSAPSLRQFAIASNGVPFEIAVPDPRAFVLFKGWLSQQPEREPVKRTRDAAQAQAVAQILIERLPQFPISPPRTLGH